MKRFLGFSLATFLYSWVIWIPIMVLGLHTTESFVGAALLLAGGCGPSIMGAIALMRGPDRVSAAELLSRVASPGRMRRGDALLAFLGYPAVFALSVAISLLFGATLPEFAGLREMVQGPLTLAGRLGYILLLGPVAEELGWRGFAQDEVQKSRSPIASSAVIGVVWWAWHLPLFFMEGTLHESQGLFSAFTVGYLFTVLAYAGFFALLYQRSRKSILIAIIAHFSINLTMAVAAPFEGSIFVISTLVLLVGVIAAYAASPAVTSAPTRE